MPCSLETCPLPSPVHREALRSQQPRLPTAQKGLSRDGRLSPAGTSGRPLSTLHTQSPCLSIPDPARPPNWSPVFMLPSAFQRDPSRTQAPRPTPPQPASPATCGGPWSAHLGFHRDPSRTQPPHPPPRHSLCPLPHQGATGCSPELWFGGAEDTVIILQVRAAVTGVLHVQRVIQKVQVLLRLGDTLCRVLL